MLEMEQAFSDATRVEDLRVPELLWLSSNLQGHGKTEEASLFCRIALRREPENVEALYLAAVLARARDDVDEATRLLTRAVRRHPGHGPSRYLLGQQLCNTKPLQPQRAAIHLEVAAARMPGVPMVLSAYAKALLGSEQPAEALAVCDEILRGAPDSQDALRSRGVALAGLRRWDEACASFDRAIALDPLHADAHYNKACVLVGPRSVGRQDVEDLLNAGLACLDRAIALDSNSAKFHALRGMTLRRLERLDEAISSIERSVELDPSDDATLVEYSMCLIRKGDWERAWPLHERRLIVSRRNSWRSIPKWTGEPIAGKSILLHAEQGLGDIIHFFRFVQPVADLGANVSVVLPAALQGLLGGRFRDADPSATYDYLCSFMSLPAALKLRLDAVPGADGYLSARPEKIAEWSARLGARRRRRIGLAWSGNPNHSNDQHRSMLFADLAPVLDNDAEFICLQKVLHDRDRPLLESLGTVSFHGDAIHDFDDTAALCSLMDLVISVDTSVAHLAGALGMPLWIMLTMPSEWRWTGYGEQTPWYSSARLFRQPRIGDWNSVVARVAGELRRS